MSNAQPANTRPRTPTGSEHPMIPASPTVAEAEKVCRDFAAKFPTPNVDRAIGYAAQGRVSWFQVYRLFQNALDDAVAEVSANG